MTTDKIEIRFSVDAAQAIDATRKQQAEVQRLIKLWEGASDAERKHANDATRTGVWRTLNTDISKLAEQFFKANPRLSEFASSVKNVATGVTAAGAAFTGLAAVAARVMADAEQQENAIRRLGGAFEEITAQTSGAMSAQQALTLQGQIQAAGIRANAHELGLLARAAREYGIATGGDATAGIEKLTNAIVNNSADALSELGLSQARATTSTQTLTNVTRTLEERFRGLSPTARSLNEDLEKIPQVMNYVANTAAQAAAGGLRAFVDMLHGAGSAASYWRDIVNLPDDRRNLAQQGRSQDAMNRRQALRERIQRQAQGVGAQFDPSLLQGMSERELQGVSRRLETGFAVRGQSARGSDLTAVFGAVMAQNDLNLNMTGQFTGIVAAERRAEELRVKAEGQGTAAPVEEWRRSKDQTAKAITNATSGVSHAFESMAKSIELASANVSQEMDNAATRAKQFAYHIGSVNADLGDAFEPLRQVVVNVARLNDLAVAAVGQDHAFRNRFQTAASALGLGGETADQQADLFGSIADSMEGGGSTARAARSRRSRIAARDRETRRMAREGSFGGRITSAMGLERDDAGNLKPLDGLRTGADMIASSLSTLQGGFADLFSNIASGSMSAGEAMQVFASKSLTSLGQIAINEGTAMLFKAIPAFIEAPPLGAAYLAGGAGLVALGMGLGAAGAATAPQVSSGSAAGANTARSLAPRSSAVPSQSRDLAPVTVVMSSLVPAGPGDAQRMRNGLREMQRRGFDGNRAPRRLES